jgi:hypothetical protein
LPLFKPAEVREDVCQISIPAQLLDFIFVQKNHILNKNGKIKTATDAYYFAIKYLILDSYEQSAVTGTNTASIAKNLNLTFLVVRATWKTRGVPPRFTGHGRQYQPRKRSAVPHLRSLSPTSTPSGTSGE